MDGDRGGGVREVEWGRGGVGGGGGATVSPPFLLCSPRYVTSCGHDCAGVGPSFSGGALERARALACRRGCM